MQNTDYSRRQILMLLKETDTSFRMLLDTGGVPNLDYAEYAASTRIECFRSALQNPDLSRMHLASMLRQARKKQRSDKSRETYWSAFMAHYVSQNANGNAGFAE